MADTENLFISNVPSLLSKAFKKKARKEFGDKKGCTREAIMAAMQEYVDDRVIG